ncbi:hypothetical protein PP178_00710 [Zeaxanthinibacter sp. PT1]|uniref:hypothetical protein n=1 Tax=Zeaxanthinibacter TaxID=561554 RepID=UPI00234B72E8|nr:hypothetical protein [Zeaxanthinibacter sp. PT1]MDC6350057.1 hypothetical protein [Zeaxanthinibacter sp. PT1]
MESENDNHFDIPINVRVLEFFRKNINSLSDYLSVNDLLKNQCGINNFFNNQEEASQLSRILDEYDDKFLQIDRREFGDFQTNLALADQAVDYSYSKFSDIEFVLEPTCGKGNFIIAALGKIENLKKVVGVEIYKPYVWETKFGILDFFLRNGSKVKPDIDIFHANAFEFDYEELAKSSKDLKTLIIGNPPWVTNSELGSIDSINLPTKSNFKKYRGLDAITGKGNFDIGEYISIHMLRCFHRHTGIFAFLIKNSVIKNILQDQRLNKYFIGNSESLKIDSKKEFNVSVSASLFISELNHKPELVCEEKDFYTSQSITEFGWYKDKFVYSIKDYDASSSIDGRSIFTWRSGVKHDCSKVMELKQVNGHYLNGLKEKVNLEENLVYGLLKSSDLKQEEANEYRKQTIITQRKIGQETAYIKTNYPLTYRYLSSNKKYFTKRKSSIYKNKPEFSIFGIGEYSFAPFKVGISGLYKSTHFTLVRPHNSKPVMLDDTCYFIGFSNLIDAQIAHFLVNSEIVQKFLKSIIFSDSKRSINKDTLMRIDFGKAYEKSSFEIAKNSISDLSVQEWNKFGQIIKSKESFQYSLM